MSRLGAGAFMGCSQLGSHLYEHDLIGQPLVLPGGITRIENSTFQNCFTLRSVSFRANKVVQSIGAAAFTNCLQLKAVEGLPATMIEIEVQAFAKCTALTEINFMDVQSIGNHAFYECYALGGSTGRLSNVEKSVTSLGVGSFYGCRSISTLSLSSNLTDIPARAFTDCSSLRSISFGTVGTVEASRLKSIGDHAFYGCNILIFVTPGELVHIGDYAFAENREFQYFSGSHALTSIGAGAFYSCKDLSKVDLSSSNNLEVIGDSAFMKTKVDVFEVPASVTRLGAFAFALCGSLRTFTIAVNSTLREIGDNAFSGTTALTTLNLPDSVTSMGQRAFIGSGIFDVHIGVSLTRVANATFENCKSLSRVYFAQDGELGRIEDSAFRGCSSLKQIAIPRTTTYIGDNAFQYCTKLGSVEIDSSSLEFGSGVFSDASALSLEDIYFNRTNPHYIGVEDAGKLVALQCVDEGNSCGCKRGYGNNVTDPYSPYFNCVGCSAGKTSVAANIEACTACDKGKYNDQAGAPECTACPPGKYVDDTGAERQDKCKNCTKGEFSATPGYPCDKCPPGSSCPRVGMFQPEKCEPGTYSNSTGKTSCFPCPAGRYQPLKQHVGCTPCEKGKFNSLTGNSSASACVGCRNGTYADQVGLAQCTPCPNGLFANGTSQEQCFDCAAIFGKTYTSNEDRTACVVDRDLLSNDDSGLSKSLLEEMFSDGWAWIGTFLISSGFVAIAAMVTLMREGDQEGLANYASRYEPLWNSFAPGFSFGSSLFLIFQINSAAPGLASAIIVFRMLHVVVGIVVTFALFGPMKHVEQLDQWISPRFSALRTAFHQEFAVENIYLVEAVIFLSCCDCTVVQFLPWHASKFFVVSEGYPVLWLLKLCLTAKGIESFVSIVCEITYLSKGYDAGSTDQAKSLLYLNIIIGISTILIEILVVAIRGSVLNPVDEESQERMSRLSSLPATARTSAGGYGDEGDDASDGKKLEEGERSVSNTATASTIGTGQMEKRASSLELSHVYPTSGAEPDFDNIEMSENPLHSAESPPLEQATSQTGSRTGSFALSLAVSRPLSQSRPVFATSAEHEEARKGSQTKPREAEI